jgi:hypothetical protein
LSPPFSLFEQRVDRNLHVSKIRFNDLNISSLKFVEHLSELLNMTCNAIDYFGVVGKNDGNLKSRSFPALIDEDEPPLTAAELWKEAITDLILLGNGNNFVMTIFQRLIVA